MQTYKINDNVLDVIEMCRSIQNTYGRSELVAFALDESYTLHVGIYAKVTQYTNLNNLKLIALEKEEVKNVDGVMACIRRIFKDFAYQKMQSISITYYDQTEDQLRKTLDAIRVLEPGAYTVGIDSVRIYIAKDQQAQEILTINTYDPNIDGIIHVLKSNNLI